MCVLALVAVVLILARMAHTSIHAHGDGWGNVYVRLSEAGAEGKRTLYITSLRFLENDGPQLGLGFWSAPSRRVSVISSAEVSRFSGLLLQASEFRWASILQTRFDGEVSLHNARQMLCVGGVVAM